MDRQHKYFTQFTYSKATFYAAAVLYCFTVLALAFYEPFHKEPDCYDPNAGTKEYLNPDYKHDYCFSEFRAFSLLFMTREELTSVRRLLMACLLGGVIGWERRQADRPAGMRTMGLVSLASALFTCSSTLGFRDGPQEWDASRISAAIPSGVGFLGAGIIFKEPVKDGPGIPVVHGLTTAASLWMSAAVGISCGGGLFMEASFTVAILLVLLRFGPRIDFNSDDDDDDEEEQAEEQGNEEELQSQNGSQAPYQEQPTEYSNLLMQKSESSRGITQSMRRRKDQPSLQS